MSYDHPIRRHLGDHLLPEDCSWSAADGTSMKLRKLLEWYGMKLDLSYLIQVMAPRRVINPLQYTLMYSARTRPIIEANRFVCCNPIHRYLRNVSVNQKFVCDLPLLVCCRITVCHVQISHYHFATASCSCGSCHGTPQEGDRRKKLLMVYFDNV